MRVQVVCAWLEEGLQSPDIRALFAPLFFLARGRIAEALHAHARLQSLPPTAGAQQLQKIVMHVVTSRAFVRCMGCGRAAAICRQKGLKGSCREAVVGHTVTPRVFRPIDLNSCVSITWQALWGEYVRTLI